MEHPETTLVNTGRMIIPKPTLVAIESDLSTEKVRKRRVHIKATNAPSASKVMSSQVNLSFPRIAAL